MNLGIHIQKYLHIMNECKKCHTVYKHFYIILIYQYIHAYMHPYIDTYVCTSHSTNNKYTTYQKVKYK